MERKIFYSDELQSEFEKTGYVIVDLLSPKQAKDLLEIYDKLEGAKGTANTNKNTYELSFFEKDVEAKKKKFNGVYDFMKPYVDALLVKYQPVMINLFNKQQGAGEVPIHQNWTFVDEQVFTSVSLWLPMQDVSRKNGTVELVPGSNKTICDYRGPSIPWVFDELNDLMKEKYMVPLELRFGQAAILDDSIIHYSGINNVEQERKAIQLILKPEEATTIHCFKNDKLSDEIQIIDVADDYFFDFDMWQPPQGGSNLRSFNFPIVKITEAQLLEKTRQNLKLT